MHACIYTYTYMHTHITHINTYMNTTAVSQYRGRSALSWAAEKGYADVTKALLHAKADPNIRDGLVSIVTIRSHGHILVT